MTAARSLDRQHHAPYLGKRRTVFKASGAAQFGRRFRTDTQFRFVEEVAIVCSITPAACGPFLEIFEFNSQDRRLNRIQTKVTTDNFVVVLGPVAVIAKQLDAI